jgi:predicted dienelactone hydrolase
MVLALAGFAEAAPYADGPGPDKVATLEASWHDPARNRDIPFLICYPDNIAQAKEPAPVIIFSHGLGGTREGYEEYGTQWASYGYVVIFPQHHGSDNAVIGHGMLAMLMGKNDLQPFLDRVADVHFVIDRVEAMNAGKLDAKTFGPFAGKLDLAKIGMSGHSFGAITTEAIVGAHYAADVQGKILDPRVKAGIAMSGSGVKGMDQDKAFGGIKIPVFSMTGTKDKMGNIGADERRTPFDHSTSPQTFLVTFNGGTHMTFVPRQRSGDGSEKATYQKFILESSTAFWDAYLRGDEKAKQWLNDSFAKELGDTGTFEKKSG